MFEFSLMWIEEVEFGVVAPKRVFEFGIVAVISYLFSLGIYSSMIALNYLVAEAAVGQWLGFFACLLICYGFVRVRLNINR